MLRVPSLFVFIKVQDLLYHKIHLSRRKLQVNGQANQGISKLLSVRQNGWCRIEGTEIWTYVEGQIVKNGLNAKVFQEINQVIPLFQVFSDDKKYVSVVGGEVRHDRK